MNIRFAKPYELDEWRVVAKDVSEIFGSPKMADDPEFIDYAERKITQKEALTAFDETTGKCVGFIGFSRHFNRVTWLGVLESYRNQGIGSKLLKQRSTILILPRK